MIERLAKINKFLDNIWPQEAEKKDSPPNWQLFLLTLFAGLVLGYLIQDAPFLGYDWYKVFFKNQATNALYPPWTSLAISPIAHLPWRLGLGLVNGISLATVGVMTYQQGKNRWRFLATLLSIFSFQMVMVLWLGAIDGYALLGILALPWTLPLILMKSTFIGFAVFTRKSWFVGALFFCHPYFSDMAWLARSGDEHS